MNELSPLAEQAYRGLVHGSPALGRYLRAATPLDEIDGLNIGSRPARRGGESGIGDLRAIPWVFAWMQSRVTLPGWYGLGTALTSWASEDPERWQRLGAMYSEWPFLRTMIDNAQVSLRKADMLIAGTYAMLADAETREAVFPALRAEFERTETSLRRLTGQQDLLDDAPWLQRPSGSATHTSIPNTSRSPCCTGSGTSPRRFHELRGHPAQRQRHRRGPAQHRVTYHPGAYRGFARRISGTELPQASSVSRSRSATAGLHCRRSG
jgi:hypothetical protein